MMCHVQPLEKDICLGALDYFDHVFTQETNTSTYV
jgi:hypothetical protein